MSKCCGEPRRAKPRALLSEGFEFNREASSAGSKMDKDERSEVGRRERDSPLGEECGGVAELSREARRHGPGLGSGNAATVGTDSVSVFAQDRMTARSSSGDLCHNTQHHVMRICFLIPRGQPVDSGSCVVSVA